MIVAAQLKMNQCKPNSSGVTNSMILCWNWTTVQKYT